MPEDYSETPEFKEWAAEVRAGMVPKLRGSAIVVSLVPKDGTDIKFAVELGYSIMLDKPIVAVVVPGAKVPEKLVKVADHILEADFDTADGRESVQARLIEILQDLREKENGPHLG